MQGEGYRFEGGAAAQRLTRPSPRALWGGGGVGRRAILQPETGIRKSMKKELFLSELLFVPDTDLF